MFKSMKTFKVALQSVGKFKMRIIKGGTKFVLPTIYLLILIFGLLISVLYIFIPSFQICPVIFAQKVCAPVGIYIALFASLPGYILVGNILNFLVGVPWGISLIIVVLITTGFYFLIGLFIDNYKKSNRERKTKLLVWATFGIFLFLFLILLFRSG